MKLLLVAAVAPLIFLTFLACEGEEELSQPTPAAPTRTPLLPLPSPTQQLLLGQTLVLVEGQGPITEVGVYLVEVETGEIWRVERPGLRSPDGRSLARKRCCTGDGALEIEDLSTSLVRRIYDGDIAGIAWSPDGTRIAFSPMKPTGPSGLYLINKDGSGLRQVADLGTWNVTWSPTSEYIAFSASGQGAVYVLHADGGEPAEIADFLSGFAWAPNADLLAVADESGLYLYDPTGKHATPLAVGRSVSFILAAGVSSQPVWSPDGTRIAFRYGPGLPVPQNPAASLQPFHVISVREPGEPVPLPPARAVSWSPDSARIALLAEGCVTGDWDIYVASAAGASPVRLTNTPEEVKEGIGWSPVGSSIAFSTGRSLTLVDADTGERRVAAEVPAPAWLHYHGSGWSPDGRFVTFGFGGDHGICD